MTLEFKSPALLEQLATLADAALDVASFGIIGFDAAGLVQKYNEFESKAAGLSPERVIGSHLFTVVAPCMNNFMVAQKFEDAFTAGAELDEEIDYVLTLRMKPVKVKLRLLAKPFCALRYVLVNRSV